MAEHFACATKVCFPSLGGENQKVLQQSLIQTSTAHTISLDIPSRVELISPDCCMNTQSVAKPHFLYRACACTVPHCFQKRPGFFQLLCVLNCWVLFDQVSCALHGSLIFFCMGLLLQFGHRACLTQHTRVACLHTRPSCRHQHAVCAATGSSSEGAPRKSALAKLKVVKLRERLRDRGLSEAGLKPELVARLFANLSASPPGALQRLTLPQTTLKLPSLSKVARRSHFRLTISWLAVSAVLFIPKYTGLAQLCDMQH